MTNTIPERAWTLGLAFLTLPVATLVLCCLSFAIGIPVSGVHLVAGILIATAAFVPEPGALHCILEGLGFPGVSMSHSSSHTVATTRKVTISASY